MWRTLLMSFAPSRVSAKIFSQKGDRAVLIEFAQPMRLEGLVGRLDNEGRSLAIELIDVSLEPAMLGLAEIEGERVERLGRAEPDVAIGADQEIGPKLIGISFPDFGIEASEATMRSASGNSRSELTSCSNLSSTPSASQRR